MNFKLLSLLKYLNRSALTPEAVKEVAAALDLTVDDGLAADISVALQTRGQAGLVPLLPRLAPLAAQWKAKHSHAQPAEEVIICSNCGHARLMQPRS